MVRITAAEGGTTAGEQLMEHWQVISLLLVLYDVVAVRSVKDASVEELMGRETIKADLSGVYGFITGKRSW